MEITIEARQSPTKMLIENALELYKRELKLERSTYSLIVYTEKGMSKRDGMRGAVYKLGPKTIGMILDSGLDMERLLITMAHEMVHVKQYAKGQVKDSKSRRARYWLGKQVRAEYYNQPWEIEAYSKDDLIELTGVVEEILPGSMFRVKVDDMPNILTCYTGGKLKQHKIKIILGDRVKLEVSPYDLTKGRVVYRL